MIEEKPGISRKLSNARKGITPVIAIVLLLLITVGAVGVLYTQFNNLVSGQNAQKQAQQLQKRQNAEYAIIGVEKASGDYNVTLKNTGDVTLDLDNASTMMVGVDGDSTVASAVRGQACTPDFGRLEPGKTEECDTGISWESDYNSNGKSTIFELQVGQSVKASYTCTERSGSSYC